MDAYVLSEEKKKGLEMDLNFELLGRRRRREPHILISVA